MLAVLQFKFFVISLLSCNLVVSGWIAQLRAAAEMAEIQNKLETFANEFKTKPHKFGIHFETSGNRVVLVDFDVEMALNKTMKLRKSLCFNKKDFDKQQVSDFLSSAFVFIPVHLANQKAVVDSDFAAKRMAVHTQIDAIWHKVQQHATSAEGKQVLEAIRTVIDKDGKNMRLHSRISNPSEVARELNELQTNCEQFTSEFKDNPQAFGIDFNSKTNELRGFDVEKLLDKVMRLRDLIGFDEKDFDRKQVADFISTASALIPVHLVTKYAVLDSRFAAIRMAIHSQSDVIWNSTTALATSAEGKQVLEALRNVLNKDRKSCGCRFSPLSPMETESGCVANDGNEESKILEPMIPDPVHMQQDANRCYGVESVVVKWYDTKGGIAFFVIGCMMVLFACIVISVLYIQYYRETTGHNVD